MGPVALGRPVSRVILLSGDREAEVRYLAGQVGITEALFGNLRRAGRSVIDCATEHGALL